MREAGADNVEVCETAGNPIVYGEKIIDSKKPTVLVYGHYDVHLQTLLNFGKPHHLSLPSATVKYLHVAPATIKARFYMHVKAFELMMQTDTLPCNIKVMIEGEEEVGSANLGIFVKQK